jgi:hypothetical protein
VRTLGELLSSDDGRAFLETRGVLTSGEAFVERLLPPVTGGLRELAGDDGTELPVYAAHQVKADYSPSVTAKIRSAWDLERAHPGVRAVLLWLDLDRAGSDRGTSSITLRGRSGTVSVRLAARRHDDKEVRFVPVDPSQLEETLHKLGAWARQQGTAAVERHGRLAAVLGDAPPGTLAEANLRLTSFLVHTQMGITAPSVLISQIIDRAPLAGALDEAVQRIDDVITVFNASIDSLVAAGIDPQVRPLRPDYLPLHYSCDRDDRRCTLVRERRGTEHLATTTCVCGASYEFHLGSTSLSSREITRTGRWSPDVTLPMYLNDMASGLVAGRSSALYGLVLNEVLEKVLARRPIPMLVPDDLGKVLAAEPGEGGLVQAYVSPS